jgi:hypothetical protein
MLHFGFGSNPALGPGLRALGPQTGGAKGPKRRETEEHKYNTYTGREASIPSFSGVPSRPGFRSEWLALEVYPEAGPNLAM